MNNYVFSTESYLELSNFIKTAKEKKSANNGSNNWKQYLRKDEDIETKLGCAEEIIDIIDSDKSDADETAPRVIENLESTKIEAIEKIVVQKLKLSETLPDDILTHINEECSNTDIDRLFKKLSLTIQKQDVIKMGESLNRINQFKDEIMINAYVQHLLFKMLREEDDIEAIKFYKDFFNRFIDVISLTISFALINTDNCPKPLQVNLKSFNVEHKGTILRNFILKCVKLEEAHFGIIESLLVKQMDLGVVKKLVEMYSASANEYSGNKFFGKLLLSTIENMEKNSFYFQQDFMNIISCHKSVWKKKALHMLEQHTQGHNLSQTMYL